MIKPDARLIPKFANESEEADWWHTQKDRIHQDFVKAAEAGTLGRGSVARRSATPTITIRLPQDDIRTARALAAHKGLRYQTYLKMLVHQALTKEAEAYAVDVAKTNAAS